MHARGFQTWPVGPHFGPFGDWETVYAQSKRSAEQNKKPKREPLWTCSHLLYFGPISSSLTALYAARSRHYVSARFQFANFGAKSNQTEEEKHLQQPCPFPNALFISNLKTIVHHHLSSSSLFNCALMYLLTSCFASTMRPGLLGICRAVRGGTKKLGLASARTR